MFKSTLHLLVFIQLYVLYTNLSYLQLFKVKLFHLSFPPQSYACTADIMLCVKHQSISILIPGEN